MWTFIVSEREPTGPYKMGFLKQSGELAFIVKDVTEAEFLKNFAIARAKLGRE